MTTKNLSPRLNIKHRGNFVEIEIKARSFSELRILFFTGVSHAFLTNPFCTHFTLFAPFNLNKSMLKLLDKALVRLLSKYSLPWYACTLDFYPCFPKNKIFLNLWNSGLI
jgi:hypothetical protein